MTLVDFPSKATAAAAYSPKDLDERFSTIVRVLELGIACSCDHRTTYLIARLAQTWRDLLDEIERDALEKTDTLLKSEGGYEWW